MMRTITLSTMGELDGLLSQGGYWANGKNCRLDHLHATGAQSRFARENLYGIYLTNASHAWMAFWMAVSDRAVLRKRSLLYVRPSIDAIGALRIAGPAALRDEAYLYLVEPRSFPAIDLRECGWEEFSLQSIVRHGQTQQNYVLASPHPHVVLVDDWQLALVNVPRLVPDLEAVLTKPLIAQARERVSHTRDVDENYIVDP